MNIEQLKAIASYHARKAKTKCQFHRLSNDYSMISDIYVFYAYYKCKRSMIIKRIILSKKGELIEIIN